MQIQINLSTIIFSYDGDKKVYFKLLLSKCYLCNFQIQSIDEVCNFLMIELHSYWVCVLRFILQFILSFLMMFVFIYSFIYLFIYLFIYEH